MDLLWYLEDTTHSVILKGGLTYCLSLSDEVAWHESHVGKCKSMRNSQCTVYWCTVGNKRLMSQSSTFSSWYASAVNPTQHAFFKHFPPEGISCLITEVDSWALSCDFSPEWLFLASVSSFQQNWHHVSKYEMSPSLQHKVHVFLFYDCEISHERYHCYSHCFSTWSLCLPDAKRTLFHAHASQSF